MTKPLIKMCSICFISKEAKYFYRGISEIPNVCRYCYKQDYKYYSKLELQHKEYVKSMIVEWENTFGKKFPKLSQISVCCKTCGGTMYLYKSQLGKKIFCSPKCIPPSFMLEHCIVCFNSFIKSSRKGGANQKTCSEECQLERKRYRERGSVLRA